MGDMIDLGDATGAGRGYLAVPEPGTASQGPGVVVLHPWWGLTPFMHRLCDRFAALGYAALAPDLHGGQTATDEEGAERLLGAVPTARRAAWTEAAVDRLWSHPFVAGGPIGVVGFSMGAGWALHLAAVRPEAIAAVVLFYGSGDTDDLSRSTAAYLGHFAEDDPWEPAAAVRAVEAGIRDHGLPVTFHHYQGVGHWFFEEDRPSAFDPAAAALAWTRTTEFLEARLRMAAAGGRS